jgi:hypothetical protein
MYGLPKDFDGSRLVGRSLWQICFGLGQIQLRFDERVTVLVTSSFVYKDSAIPDPKTIEIPDLPAVQSMLLQLLHCTIVNASGDQEGTLTLEFDNGHVLQCCDRSHYEAYEIILGDQHIIV